MAEREYGSLTVETSREGKVLFPDDGLTKGDLIAYYERIADVMLPHIEGRPLTMHRFPDGIGEEGFYQKEMPDYFPDWFDRVKIEKREGGTQTQVTCENTASLVYLANQACITPHIWLSRADDLERPDRIIFDLDPPDDDFAPVREGAFRLRGLLNELDLPSFAMLTGSRGVHVVIPIQRGPDFETGRRFARAVAKKLADHFPDELTVEQRIAKRGERLFLDTARNAYGQTAVAPYALRALRGAPVATPVDWSEMRDGDLRASSYSVNNIFRRLSQKPDPWKDIRRFAEALEGRLELLERAEEG